MNWEGSKGSGGCPPLFNKKDLWFMSEDNTSAPSLRKRHRSCLQLDLGVGSH